MLVSLFFVIGTIIEFAIVLWLKQRQERSPGRSNDGLRKSANEQFKLSQRFCFVTQVSDNDCKANGTNEMHHEEKTIIQKIDEASFALFTITYLIFNVCYFVFNS